MKNLIIATTSRGKFVELKRLLDDHFEEIYSLLDFPEKIDVAEDSTSYAGNAMKKARKVGEHFRMPALADDSGLEVAALDGRPGIHSSRYGKNDDERTERLLDELDGIPWDGREAKFKAYVALYLPEKDRCYVFYGELKGFIGFEKHGSGGFGYDPVFYSPELGKYLAEIPTDQKNTVSHRGRAVALLKKFVETI
ncbi:MAG: RdgB/HAM1 family non-canonical purine NTP pyrophosphatase [Syntrophorhabdaceae bacterium]|nr:RdgB/HAM1 family non-canonical purine NTP pyrophosphatase [Syntrophorhabdaceae bacterium]MDD4196018.1 RdgB/HAM1 family non-canonical purine NTP pyrophosphatase [Syntrophorhabdaceae bacterium]HOC46270.1 RdgB/HAM1 family non-canonical purine NTP pyrophosphatase [Syntrophorhabdaceae bacterium]